MAEFQCCVCYINTDDHLLPCQTHRVCNSCWNRALECRSDLTEICKICRVSWQTQQELIARIERGETPQLGQHRQLIVVDDEDDEEEEDEEEERENDEQEDEDDPNSNSEHEENKNVAVQPERQRFVSREVSQPQDMRPEDVEMDRAIWLSLVEPQNLHPDENNPEVFQAVINSLKEH